ncbi:hypothetical protein CC78DRAFT_543161 [Lojkania enalia]|uniref:Uncharacterized protein n=1 Tax=Lojkania enalia TaxID=147567 RepID=A0A9P4KDE3_9PLEO|nr:hypothetical protein CC78DRAFT_543161 [Didymosphaeria enalia]
MKLISVDVRAHRVTMALLLFGLADKMRRYCTYTLVVIGEVKVAKGGRESFSGYLFFDFIALGERQGEDVEPKAIECNSRTHIAVALCNEYNEMVDDYLSIFNATSRSAVAAPASDVVVPKSLTRLYDWIGHDLVTLGIIPSFSLLIGQCIF